MKTEGHVRPGHGEDNGKCFAITDWLLMVVGGHVAMAACSSRGKMIFYPAILILRGIYFDALGGSCPQGSFARMDLYQLVGAKGSCGQLPQQVLPVNSVLPDSGDPVGKCDVIGNISSTAWYAAVRGLSRFRDLSNRILIHHSTMSQSRYGCSMSLAKCILSQNVRRVQVCKRHVSPTGTARPRTDESSRFMVDVWAWVSLRFSFL